MANPSLISKLSSNVPLSDFARQTIELADRLGISGRFSIGLNLPGFEFSHSSSQFLFWIPGKLPTGKSVSILSSRMSRRLDRFSDWFDALRTLAVGILNDDKFLMTADDTTADRFVTRTSQLFDIPMVRIRPIPKRANKVWFEHHRNDRNVIFFLPLNETKKTVPDFLLSAIAKQVFALSIKAGGNVEKALARRLGSQTDTSSTFVLESRLTKQSVFEELISSGATAWYLFHGPEQDTVAGNRITSQLAPTLDLSEIDSERYLIHWTRGRTKAWPDQSETSFLDDLILGSTRANQSELSTLCRILATRRLLATNFLTRAPQPVVCFSEIPLTELSNKTTFRSHLGRWDAQPYGIAIEKSWLETTGTRKVVYGDESQWENLSATERPFFQVVNQTANSVDWRLEKEWRHVGDLDLAKIPIGQALVFVPTQNEASVVSELSNWPVLLMSNDGS